MEKAGSSHDVSYEMTQQKKWQSSKLVQEFETSEAASTMEKGGSLHDVSYEITRQSSKLVPEFETLEAASTMEKGGSSHDVAHEITRQSSKLGQDFNTPTSSVGAYSENIIASQPCVSVYRQDINLKRAMEPSDDENSEDPKSGKLITKINVLRSYVISQRKKIKSLNQTVRRSQKKITNMLDLYAHLKEKNMINSELEETLSQISGPINKLLERQLIKAKEKKLEKLQ